MTRESVDTQSPDYPERVAEAMGISGDRLRASRPAEPWRFDVPEVPAHVTAMEVEGCLIVRVPGMPSVPGGWWKQRFSDGTVDNAKPLSVWLQFAPLVECPDPRATP